MTIQADTLFTHNEQGRMTFVNEPVKPAKHLAPRLFLGVTKMGLIYRFRDDLPISVCDQLEKLILSEPTLVNLCQHPASFKKIESVLHAHAPIQEIEIGPAFQFPPPFNQVPEIVKVDKHNAELLSFGFSDTVPELDFIQPCVAVIEQGRAVSVCHTVRISPQAEEAGVDTLAHCRGKGYALKVASGWAQAVNAKGKIPIYSTSWENTSSQRVAQKLGLIQFGVDYCIT